MIKKEWYWMSKNNNNMEQFNLIYHFNPYNNNWYCIPREEYVNYFQGDCTKCGSGFNIEGAYLSYKNKTK